VLIQRLQSGVSSAIRSGLAASYRAKPMGSLGITAFVLLLTVGIFQGACSGGSRLPQASDPGTPTKDYSTSFPMTENPISENGHWIGGQSAGSNIWGKVLWGNVQTRENMAVGVSNPTKFGDPTAILSGAWEPNHTVSATVRIKSTPRGKCCREVELRLRTTISAKSITGYEAYCSVMPDNPYCHIARWNGPNGSYCNIESSTPSMYAADGDVLAASVTGTNPVVVTMFKNGTQILQATDSGQNCSPGGPAGPFSSGNPGIGFYGDQDSDWSSFGFSTMSAQDDTQKP